jgi:hypothetical protein
MSKTLAGGGTSIRTGMRAAGGQGPSGSAPCRVSPERTGSIRSLVSPSSAAVSAGRGSAAGLVASAGLVALDGPEVLAGLVASADREDSVGPEVLADREDSADLAGRADLTGRGSSVPGAGAGGVLAGPSAATCGQRHWRCSPRSR